MLLLEACLGTPSTASRHCTLLPWIPLLWDPCLLACAALSGIVRRLTSIGLPAMMCAMRSDYEIVHVGCLCCNPAREQVDAGHSTPAVHWTVQGMVPCGTSQLRLCIQSHSFYVILTLGSCHSLLTGLVSYFLSNVH